MAHDSRLEVKNNNNVVDFLAKIRFTTVQQLLFRCIQRQAN